MTTVSFAASSKLDVQTAAKLFSATTAATTSSSASNAVLEISSGYKVSGVTTGAVAALTKGGTDQTTASAAAKAKNLQVDQKPLSFTNLTLSFSTQTGQITGLTDEMMKEFMDYVTGPDLPPVAPGYPPQQKELGIVGNMLQLQAVNKMTSQQLSDALYGDGIPSVDPKYGDFINGPKSTFASWMDDLKDDTAYRQSQITNMELPEDVRASFDDDVKFRTAAIKGMQEAYDNHTLQFTKAADIPGLNYSATTTAKGYSAIKGAMESGGTETYDRPAMDAYAAAHPNSMWTTYAGVAMMWSW